MEKKNLIAGKTKCKIKHSKIAHSNIHKQSASQPVIQSAINGVKCRERETYIFFFILLLFLLSTSKCVRRTRIQQTNKHTHMMEDAPNWKIRKHMHIIVLFVILCAPYESLSLSHTHTAHTAHIERNFQILTPFSSRSIQFFFAVDV